MQARKSLGSNIEHRERAWLIENGADIGVGERIRAPDVFNDGPVCRDLEAFVRQINKKSHLNLNIR